MIQLSLSLGEVPTALLVERKDDSVTVLRAFSGIERVKGAYGIALSLGVMVLLDVGDLSRGQKRILHSRGLPAVLEGLS